MRYAAIDIGTVTCRLLVAHCSGTSVVPLARRAVITNLGEDVSLTGMLKPEAMQRVFTAVEGFLQVISEFEGATTLVAVATSASRDAKNTETFRAGLARLGVTLSVIPGEKEAALSFMGASADFENTPLIVSDIGGGSTEIIAGIAGQKPFFVHSFNIGCRRLTENFLTADPLNPDQVLRARHHIRTQFEPYFQQFRGADYSTAPLVSVAGTATSIVSMVHHMRTYDASRVHGAHVTQTELDCLYNELAITTLAQRKSRTGLQPERASVINSGIIIQQEVMRCAQATEFIASESDILQGIVLAAAQGDLNARAL